MEISQYPEVRYFKRLVTEKQCWYRIIGYNLQATSAGMEEGGGLHVSRTILRGKMKDINLAKRGRATEHFH
jgi:hypothetical protein